ncbi:MAG: TrkA family potassium uptake protein [SAR202 cluster bacterium]|nr:TrkA family potassium uptake protein [SAR202 cluster bacterium]
MYIIVVGGGEVGFHLVRSLLQNDHEVLCIEKDPERCALIAEELGSVISRGDGCEAATLEKLGAGRADILVAATGEDEDNLVACQVAKHKFNVSRTIARIHNPENKVIFELLGVDATVSSTEVILAQIEQEMPAHPLISLQRLKGSNLELVNVEIPPNSRVVNTQLSEIELPTGSMIVLIYDRDRGIQLIEDNTVLQEADEVVAVVRPDQEEELRQILTNP